MLDHPVGHHDVTDRQRRIEAARHAGENDCAATESVGQQRGDDRGVDLAHPGSREYHVVAVEDPVVNRVCAIASAWVSVRSLCRAASSCGMAQISPMVTLSVGVVVVLVDPDHTRRFLRPPTGAFTIPLPDSVSNTPAWPAPRLRGVVRELGELPLAPLTRLQ